MEQSIEEVLNRLVAVEDAAQQMQDAVEEQKKSLPLGRKRRKKRLTACWSRRLPTGPGRSGSAWSRKRRGSWRRCVSRAEKQLLQIQHKYDTEHDKISDEILQSMIRT